MKKITFILISILLLVLLTSCGENLAPQTTRLDELKLQYDPIGVGHNEALEEIHQGRPRRSVARTGLRRPDRPVFRAFAGPGPSRQIRRTGP